MRGFTHFPASIQAGVLAHNVLDGCPFPAQMVRQVHGTDILEVDDYGPREAGYDAMVTARPELTLMVKTADCIPAVLADAEAGLVAAVHAGWRGLVADILPKTVADLLARGARPERLFVGLGPSLGTCCSAFSQPYEEIPAAYHDAILENGHVDLNGIADRQLREAGVLAKQVQRIPVCTACDPAWFSWRRDRTAQRFGTFIKRV